MSVPGPEVVDRSRISEHRPKLLERRGALVSVRSGIAAAGQPDLRASLWEQVDAVYLDAGRAEETDSLGLCKGLDQAASHREAGSLGRQHGQPVLREETLFGRIAASTRQDAQAKALGEWLRARVVSVPRSVVP